MPTLEDARHAAFETFLEETGIESEQMEVVFSIFSAGWACRGVLIDKGLDPKDPSGYRLN